MSQPDYTSQILGDLLKGLVGVLDDPDVEEVMVNEPGTIFVERTGEFQKLDLRLASDSLFGALTILGKREGKDIQENSANSIIDTQIGDYRVAAALAPVSVHGHSMCIRRHACKEIPLEKFPVAEAKTEPQDQPDPKASPHEWLTWAVANKKTVLVSGGTSAGKTSFMRSLIQRSVDPSERLLFIEDVPELKINAPNIVCFRTNEDKGITTRTLVRLALRYRPDRLIVGEVRGIEAFDLMQAINTGHEGSLASIHANSAFAALSRLETLVLTAGTGWPLDAVRMEIASTIDYVVQLKRTNEGRVISEVIEVNSYEQSSGYCTRTIL